MKHHSLRTYALVLTTLMLALAGSSALFADSYGPYHPYTYGHNGYWNQQHVYHHWDQYNGQRGYWMQRNDGVRIFITI